MTHSADNRKTSGYYRDEFGRLARFYDGGLRLAFRLVGGEAAFRREVMEAAGITAGQRVLDVNCGTGTQALLMAGRVGTDGSVAGIDLSPEMIAVARRKEQPGNVEFAVGNAEMMPFSGDSFDRATMTLAYHEMNRNGRTNALSEIARVLRPGGLLVIADLKAPDSLFSRVAMGFIRLTETDTLSDMWQQTISHELEETGFRVTGRRVLGRRLFEIVSASPAGHGGRGVS